MTHNIEFHILFDGNTPGLAEHRLSLTAFHKAMGSLLNAFRRAADRVRGGGQVSEKTRKHSKYARGLDLQLANITDGCVQLTFQCRPSSDSGNSGEQEAEVTNAAIDQLLTDIEAEGNGRGSSSPSVQRFLRDLPAGLRRQEYESRIDGKTFRKVSVAPRNEAEQRGAILPKLIEIRGVVVGAKFDNNSGKVHIRDSSGFTHHCRAMPEIVDLAVQYRRDSVAGKMLVHPNFKRLLLVYPEVALPPIPPPEERARLVFDRWDSVLKRLAE